ncbi:MAG TPA: zf-HC2 domain-containing protein [Vicinamibacterales bacterium]|nr:zf-HC2 domain-containing protein [Vicinamibacterales bacterium]
MTCQECIERLGDVVEDTLSPDLRTQVDAHCAACDACRDLLNDLIGIHAAAATLERHAPPPAVWEAIAAQISAPASTSRRRGSLAQLPQWAALAAAAALVMMLGTAAWLALGPASRKSGGDSAAELARAAASELHLAEEHYLNAIASLEQLTVSRDSALDPAIAAEIAQSLQSIDRAIADSRAALRSEPGSFVAHTSLLEALRMKVALLQETVSLMNARS